MKKLVKIAALLMVLAAVFAAPVAFASAEAATEDAAAGGGSGAMATSVLAIGCVIGMGLAAAGCGIGMGNASAGATQASARNPGFYKNIFKDMIIGLALIEGLAIYTLVLALLFMLGNPLG